MANPYDYSQIEQCPIDGDIRTSSRSWIFVGTILIAALLNAIFRATVSMSDEAVEISEIGFFAGEHMVLTTWFAWGPRAFFSRLSVSTWIGMLWMAAAWIGFAITATDPSDELRQYRSEMLQFFTVCPCSFLISSLPLFALRRYQWHLCDHGGSDHKTTVFERLPFVLFAAAVGVAWRFFSDPKDITYDLGIGAIIGFVLGVYSLFAIPCFALALLKDTISPVWLLVAFFAAGSIAVLVDILISIPGAGGAQASLLRVAIFGSFAAMIPVTTAFVLWRLVNLRLFR